MPADPKTVSKGVARGHVLCCCAVVFVCFMLTCLNLYMLSSTRAVLRHLDSRFDNHPRALQRQQLERQQVAQSPEEAAVAAAAMLLQQQQQLEQQLQQQQGADDFVLLAPSDLDNAWTTQTGRLLVPVGQPEEDDDGWKQMQVQLAEQNKAQQEHIESLHDKLNDQYRAREELQRDQQDLLREHHKLSTEHQRQMAKKDRALLKERHRALRKGAQHQDELQQYKAEMANLKKVVEEVQSLDPAARPAAAEAAAPPTSTSNIAVDAVVAASAEKNNGGDPVVTVTALETAAPSSSGRDDATTEPTNSLEHIFSAVFGGANPGAYFFPSYSVGADQAEQGRSGRGRRDLDEMRAKRKQRLAALAERLNGDRRRRRRHHEEAESTGPMMRIDDGELVPLAQAPVLKAEENQQGARRRRLALHRGRHQA